MNSKKKDVKQSKKPSTKKVVAPKPSVKAKPTKRASDKKTAKVKKAAKRPLPAKPAGLDFVPTFMKEIPNTLAKPVSVTASTEVEYDPSTLRTPVTEVIRSANVKMYNPWEGCTAVSRK